MLISHRHQFIYTKTVKTASTSIESYFERFCMAEGSWIQVHARDEHDSPEGVIGYRGAKTPANAKWWNHMSAQEIFNRIGSERWNKYTKFCTIRNPYEKCISAFEHFGRSLVTKNEAKASPANKNIIDDPGSEQDEFLAYITANMPLDRDKYTINGHFCMDEVIRYEFIHEDLQRMCDRLGVPYEPSYLPNFKADIRRPKATADRLYTDASKALVRQKFAYELELFGYGFPRNQI